MGLLYAIGAVVGVPIFTYAIFGVLAGGGAGPAELAASVGLLALSVGQGFLAYGLRKLRSWARVPAIILSCIGLIGFPIGTLISAYILYLLVSKKGSMVFSSQYQDIIRQTPHIKYRTSKVVWFFLILLLGLIGLGVVVAVFG